MALKPASKPILAFLVLLLMVAPRVAAIEQAGAPTAWSTTTIRPVRYDLALDFGRSRFAASGWVSVRNSGATPVASLPFLLHRWLRVQSVKDTAGAALAFTRTVTAFDDWDVLQVNFVEVRPAEPLAPGASMTLSIAYAETWPAMSKPCAT
jgi:hypothetical protein